MSRKPAPTLIDEVYRHTFDRKTPPGWKDSIAMRRALESARRFIADERMAAFMADLSTTAFLRSERLNYRLAESLRVSARLPHETIWVEYPLRSYTVRSAELQGDPLPKLSEIAIREGWLIQQHPAINTACMMHLFITDDYRQSGEAIMTFPFVYAWMNDDNPLPWHLSIAQQGRFEWHGEPREAWASEIIVGIHNYRTAAVGCVRSPLIEDPPDVHQRNKMADDYMNMLHEWVGVVRRAWALLATIDHLPLTYGQVRQSKGFLARGRIRKYLDHKTITLNIPAKKDTRVIARQAIAMAHRKRHEVRAHWRDDWRNPPSKRCQPHLWEFVDASNPDHICCSLCHGQQFLIHKHERGDASIGYVTHDYRVKHEMENG